MLSRRAGLSAIAGLSCLIQLLAWLKKLTNVLRKNLSEGHVVAKFPALSGECRNVAIGRQTRKIFINN